MGFDISIVKQGLVNTEGVEVIPAGAVKVTFDINGENILQTSDHNEAGRMRKAAELHRMMDQSEIPVPEIVEDHSSDNIPYLVTEYLQDTRPEGEFSDWEPEAIKEVVFQAGRYLGALHKWFSWDQEQYGFIWADDDGLKLEGHDTWSGYIGEQGEEYIEDASTLGGVDKWVLKVADEALDEAVELAPDYPEASILHGDYRIGNMIIDDDGVRAVLDWDNALAGDSEFEYTAAEESIANNFHYKGRDEVREIFRSGYEAGGSQPPERREKQLYAFLSSLEATASLTNRDQSDQELEEIMGQYMERNAEKLLM